MGRRLLLVVLACVVGGLWWLQTRQEELLVDPGTVALRSPLFGGLEADSIDELHIENLERGVELGLVRDEFGAWQIIDPIEARGYPEIVALVTGELARGTGRPAPDLTLEQAGLAPPRAVVEFVAENGTRRGRIELGSVDVERGFVYVRVPDHSASRRADGSALFLTSRSLESVLQRDRDGYRDPLLVPRSSADVLRIRRSGSLPSLSAPLDLLLERGGQGDWRLAEPVRMQADPNVARTILRALLDLSVERFYRQGSEAVEHFGLSDPAVEIALERTDGTVVELALQPQRLGTQAEIWYATRKGSDEVVQLAGRGVRPLVLGHETLFDQRLVRALRRDIQRVELHEGERTLVVERKGVDWSVESGGHSFPASLDRVEDLLAVLERAEVAAYPPMESFPASDPPRSYRVLTVGGATFGGALGETWSGAGLGGRAFLRAGDELPGLIDDELLPWFELQAEDLRRQSLWTISEGAVKSVTLARELGADRRVVAFERTDNRWLAADGGEPPQVFYRFLERLLAARVAAWIEPPLAFTNERTVRLELLNGPSRTLGVGLLDDRLVAQLEDGSQVELEAIWSDELDELLR